ncbi:hypothetical protein B296_00038961, partial [Ensete ventricosum]
SSSRGSATTRTSGRAGGDRHSSTTSPCKNIQTLYQASSPIEEAAIGRRRALSPNDNEKDKQREKDLGETKGSTARKCRDRDIALGDLGRQADESRGQRRRLTGEEN